MNYKSVDAYSTYLIVTIITHYYITNLTTRGNIVGQWAMFVIIVILGVADYITSMVITVLIISTIITPRLM